MVEGQKQAIHKKINPNTQTLKKTYLIVPNFYFKQKNTQKISLSRRILKSLEKGNIYHTHVF